MDINDSRIQKAADYLLSLGVQRPKVALILGSGLGNFSARLEIQVSTPTKAVPHFPPTSVAGHAGEILFGSIKKSARMSPPLLLFKGRIHYYESGHLSEVLFPTLLAHRLGVSVLIATNAAGGLNRNFMQGDLMLIRDVISLTFLSLYGGYGAGQIFKPRHRADGRPAQLLQVDPEIQVHIREAARLVGVNLQEGVYCWLKGPSYETSAEIEMLRRLGADAVGMSTVPEMMLARALGMRVAGLSLISNMATGMTGQKLSHDEVTETARIVEERFAALMEEILLSL